MFRRHLHARHAQGERDFRWRGGDVSRLEGLTDAVFALALTLLVVSLEVPRTFAQLTEAFLQAPVFLACFAILFYCWHAHYQFHRRYGLEDPLTIFYNALLLFLVALYVYPLKFLFSLLWNALALQRGFWVRDALGAPVPAAGGTVADGPWLPILGQGDMTMLMVLYGLGFAALFGTFALMTHHAWRWRTRLELDAREELVTRATLRAHLISTGFGLTSTALVLLDAHLAPFAGMMYGAMGPVHALHGWRSGRAILRLRPAVEE